MAVVGSGDIPLGAILRPRLTTTCFDLPRTATAVGAIIERPLAALAGRLDPHLRQALAASLPALLEWPGSPPDHPTGRRHRFPTR
jgi:hypothetical protein